MSTEANQHPDAQELAVFLEGRLQGEPRARLVAHLARCPDCAEVFADAAEFLAAEAEQTAGTAVRGKVIGQGRFRRWWLLALPMAAVLAIYAVRTPLLELAGQQPAVSLDVLGDGWTDHGWPEARNAGAAYLDDETRAFRLGVRVVELDLALLGGSTELAAGLAGQVRDLATTAPGAQGLRAWADQLAATLATGGAVDSRKVRARVGAEVPWLVASPAYVFGAWCVEARLAAGQRRAAFFRSDQSRQILASLPEGELQQRVAAVDEGGSDVAWAALTAALAAQVSQGPQGS